MLEFLVGYFTDRPQGLPGIKTSLFCQSINDNFYSIDSPVQRVFFTAVQYAFGVVSW
jgi:hypothetical protein